MIFEVTNENVKQKDFIDLTRNLENKMKNSQKVYESSLIFIKYCSELEEN